MSEFKELEVNIDFNEASQAWRRNKKCVNGMFYYTCAYRHTNNKRCSKIIIPPKNNYIKIFNPDAYLTKIQTHNLNVFCYRHQNRVYDPNIHI